MPRIPCTCKVPGTKCWAHPDGPECHCIRDGELGDLTAPLLIQDPECLHTIHQEPTP